MDIRFDPSKDFQAVTGIPRLLPSDRGEIQAFLCDVTDSTNKDPSRHRMALIFDFEKFQPLPSSKAQTISGACQIAEFDFPASMKPQEIKERLQSEIYLQINALFKDFDSIVKDLNLITNSTESDHNIHADANLYERFAQHIAIDFNPDFSKKENIKCFRVSESYQNSWDQDPSLLTFAQIHERDEEMESKMDDTNARVQAARNHWRAAGRKLHAALAFNRRDADTASKDEDTQSELSSGIPSSEDPEDDYQKAVHEEFDAPSSPTSTVPLRGADTSSSGSESEFGSRPPSPISASPISESPASPPALPPVNTKGRRYQMTGAAEIDISDVKQTHAQPLDAQPLGQQPTPVLAPRVSAIDPSKGIGAAIDQAIGSTATDLAATPEQRSGRLPTILPPLRR